MGPSSYLRSIQNLELDRNIADIEMDIVLLVLPSNEE